MKELSSRERILRTIRGEPVDRVPISPPIPWKPDDFLSGRKPRDWQMEPNFRKVARLVEKHCDSFCRGPVGQIFDRRFLLTPRKYIKAGEHTVEGKRHKRVTYVHTPKGTLRTVDEWDEGVATVWYTEPLLKDKEDVEKLLSVPYEFEKPDLQPFFKLRDLVGDRGVMEVGISTPLVCVSRLFEFGQFLEWCASEREIIVRLLDTVFERIRIALEYILKEGVGPSFWFGGSEQATPPMMSPKFYDELVVAYDKRLFDLVHQYGGIVHVHCHGKVRGVLKKLVDMGADALDPVEPPPDGDVTMEEAKKITEGRLMLMGNIEFHKLEFGTPEEIDRLVYEAIVPGGKEHTMLYPTATAITSISDRHRDNAIQYIESGLKYGKF